MHFGATDSEWDRFSAHLVDLLPVVSDLTVPISIHSKLGGLGKTPSRVLPSGEAVGIAKWTSHETTAAEVAEWRKDNRHGICIQTRRLRAIDIDIPDPDLAQRVQDTVESLVGVLPCRSRSNSGKRLLTVLVEGDFPKRVIRLDGGIIELLANGQQFIAAGTHTSGVRYEWNDAPEVALTQAQLDAVWYALADEFGASVEQRVGEKLRIARRAGDADDEVVRFLEKTGRVTGYADDGRVDVLCPWADEHSVDSGVTSTSWFPAGVGGFAQGHFRCLHASHMNKTDGDFLNAIGIVADEFDVVEPAAPVVGGRRDTVLGYWRAKIAACASAGALRDGLVDSIRVDARVDDVVRELLAQVVRDRLRALGEELGIAAVRKMLVRGKPEVVRDGEVELPEWCAEWVFRADKDKYFNTDTGEEMTITGFNQRFNRHLPPAEPGEVVSAHQYVQGAMPSVAGVRYIPYLAERFSLDGKEFVNGYRAATVPEAAPEGTEDLDAIGVVEQHLQLLAGKQGADVLRSWMAWNVQNPGRKVRWVPLIKGVEGDGKSVLATLMVGVMGGPNVNVISPQVLGTQFNGWAEGFCVGVLEEIRMIGHNRHDTANAVKAALTNDRIPIHRKGMDEYQTINTQNYLAFTNHDDAVPLTDSDRRWCVIFSPFRTKEAMQAAMPEAYFDRLHDVIYGSAPALRRWLLDVDLSDFKPNGHAPDVVGQDGTSGKQRMTSLARNPELELVEDAISQGGLGIGPDILSNWHFAECYRQVGGTSVTTFGRHLRTLGWEQVENGKSLKWQGRSVRVWSKTCKNLQDARILLDETLKQGAEDF